MKKIRFKLSFIIVLLLIQGCATNDSNSLLVRWWNDGFIYSEKEGEANGECSKLASKYYPVLSSNGDNTQWHKLHNKCMREKGYNNYSQ